MYHLREVDQNEKIEELSTDANKIRDKGRTEAYASERKKNQQKDQEENQYNGMYHTGQKKAFKESSPSVSKEATKLKAVEDVFQRQFLLSEMMVWSYLGSIGHEFVQKDSGQEDCQEDWGR